MTNQRPDAKDLWGPAFLDSPPDSAPVALLREQADALTRRTGGRIIGEVLGETDASHSTIWTSLYARVPALDDYQHKLVSIAHPLVVADPTHPFPITAVDTQGVQTGEIGSIEEFGRWLETTLSSREVHNVINSLLTYGNSRAAS